jgi:hypothetical protein
MHSLAARTRLLAAVTLLLVAAAPALSRAGTTTVYYPLQPSGVSVLSSVNFSNASGGLVAEFESDEAGLVQPGGFKLVSFHLGFDFSGIYGDYDRVLGRADMRLTDPWSNWWLNPNGAVLTLYVSLFADVFEGTTELFSGQGAPNRLQMTPTAASLRFLNGNPFLPGAFGGPTEVRGSIDFDLDGQDELLSFSSLIGFSGHEAARVLNAPEPRPVATALTGLLCLAGARWRAGRIRSR